MAKVVLVGAGPGDPDLLTLKGKEYIQNADLIVYDRLASKDILEYAKPGCEFVFVGKENHHHVMKQDDINAFLAEKSAEYELIVRLKGGDPYVFGRGGEEALYLLERGIEVEVVPGVSSCIAVLESAGIPITHRGISKGFQVITAHSRKNEISDIPFGELMDETVTYVFLMGLSHVGVIAEGLLKAGRSADTKIAVISNGTTPKQRKAVGTLADIEKKVEEAELVSPAIIVVGEVVGLSEELALFEKKPLFGKTFIVPYIRGFKYSFREGEQAINENRLGAFLREKGACVCSVKVGEIWPVTVSEKILPDRKETESAWLVFTSANGVYSFMYNLEKQGYDMRALSGYRLGVIGKKTQKALAEFGLKADLVPAVANGKSLGEELVKVARQEDKIFIYSAAESDKGLEEALKDNCSCKRITVYENKVVEISPIDERADGVLLSSGSSAIRILPALKGKLPEIILTIGPNCSKTLEKMGITKYIQAEEPSYESMLRSIIGL